MRVSRSEPGVVISSAAHAGLLVAALVLFSDARKFEDAPETIPVEVVTDDALTQVTKGEKTAHDPRPAPRVDKVAKESETKPHPPLAEAKKDVPTPPPSLKRLPDPGADDRPEPTPPKRVAALPPAPEPPERPVEKKPEPPKPVEKPAEAKPTPPVKPKAAAPEEKEREEPKDAEVVKPKPPVRPKPEKEAKEEPKPAPEKPKETRLKTDEVAKLLQSKKAEEKPAKPQNSAEGETAEKSAKGSKPKSGDENAPKSKFDAANIANLLSKEAPQRRESTGKEVKTASLGAPEGAAAKLSASMEARIASYIHDHYHPCWASGLSLGGATFAPVVEFHLSREGALEGRPRLVNPSANPVEQARGEQAVQAVRRCSPMRIPAEFMPYYEEALHEVTIRFQDAN
ncbi:cell envelope biogenesis protein TolA [Methylocystis iwaonis]|uniref:cell envelope biogenesis protein TolA n=1 Tax=Methylocystis iwaonis TaxID=2885079 RepID=UPI002E7B0B19|nr:cell envelope biogenesis protein TolA [Methylocystis iwaonis]